MASQTTPQTHVPAVGRQRTASSKPAKTGIRAGTSNPQPRKPKVKSPPGGEAGPPRQLKRQKVNKTAILPQGYRLFKVLINGFKQPCHLIVEENCTLRVFREKLFECQKSHPQGIPDGALSRAVILKSKPTTMKTNCMVDESAVINESDTKTVASLGNLGSVHLYLLCPGPSLPKEFPAPHRRLAKRDTQVCEAHSKQERRAVRRSAKNIQALSTAVLPRNIAGTDPGAEQPSGDVGAILAAPSIAKFSNYSDTTGSWQQLPVTVPVQMQPGTAPVFCSVEQSTHPNLDADEKPLLAKRETCDVEGCTNPLPWFTHGNCMPFPQAYITQGGDINEVFGFCISCVGKFHSMTTLNESVLTSMLKCPYRQKHQQHLGFATTPHTAGSEKSTGKIVFLCTCIEKGISSARASDREKQAFTKFLSIGMRPLWSRSEGPIVKCIGSSSVHLNFPYRANRVNLLCEVVTIDDKNRTVERAFREFGEHLDDQLHLVPANPQQEVDFMLEGLAPERVYGIRYDETVSIEGVPVKELNDTIQKFLTVTSKPITVQTSPHIPAQRPFVRLATNNPKSVTVKPESPLGSSEELCGSEDALLRLATAAADRRLSVEHSKPPVLTLGSKEGRHSFAVPIRMDEDEDLAPQVALEGNSGTTYTVYPQATPLHALKQTIALADGQGDEDQNKQSTA